MFNKLLNISALLILLLVTINAGYAQDNDLNWSYNKTYSLDEQGNPIVIGESKVYVDEFGKPLQQQFKNYTNDEVFAIQPIYDRLGNPVISTLPAPINNNIFGYVSGFVKNVSGGNYGSINFEGGKLNNPDPVGDQYGTLGWYYSNLNNVEPYTPISSYPYARSYTEEKPDPRLSKAAGPGEAYKMGSGHEAVVQRSLITSGELDHYYSLRNHFVST